MGETTLYIVTLDLTAAAHFAIQLSYPMSYLQHFLQSRAGGLFVLVEGVCVDIQRGGGLAVAEDARYRGNIRAARDHQTGGGVPEGMDVQLLRQAVLLEDQFEAVGEGGERHGELRSLTAEQKVIIGQLPLIVGLGDVCTFLPVLPQKTFHLGGEVHIAVTCTGLGFLNEDLCKGRRGCQWRRKATFILLLTGSAGFVLLPCSKHK